MDRFRCEPAVLAPSRHHFASVRSQSRRRRVQYNGTMTVYDVILVIFGSVPVLLVGFGIVLIGTLAGRFYAESRRIPGPLD